MPTYALRAEAKVDVDGLLDALVDRQIPVPVYTVTGQQWTVLAELDVALDLDGLLAVIATVPDGHVMYRTVQQGSIATVANLGDEVRCEPGP